MNLNFASRQHHVKGLSALINQYDVFVIDIWGVLHDGLTTYDGVIDCLDHLRANDKTIVFLSNTPRPAKSVVQSLSKMEIDVSQDWIITSGDLVRNNLISKSTSPFNTDFLRIFHLGADRNQDILAGLNVECVDNIEDANLFLLSSYRDEDEDIAQIKNTLDQAKQLGLPAICPNPDVTVRHGEKMRYCAGYFTNLYEQMGGKAYYFGKPHTNIYTHLIHQLNQRNFQNLNRILCIGDTVETDILGAHKAGLDSLLVLTGNGKNYLNNDLKDDKILYPNYLMNSLRF